MTGSVGPTADKAKEAELSAGRILNEKQTDWRSMWICIFLQFVVGVQISVYYMSMWPYLSGLDKNADFDFMGWIVAACSIGSSISNPIFGVWNQKTMSVKWPAIFGFLMAAVGQVWYGLLTVATNVKWWMLFARFFTGFGVGNIAVLRVYAATASTTKDRMRAISFGTAGFVSGISFGPVISAVFTPLGADGIRIGFLVFNMYTVVAYLMALTCFLSCIVIYIFFEESYAGIVTKEEKENDDLVVPMFDIPVDHLHLLVHDYQYNLNKCGSVILRLKMMFCYFDLNFRMSTPLTTVLYDWKDSDAILYNGITLALSCIVSVTFHVILGTSRIGKMDKRNQMLIGIFVFLLYHVCMYPWEFYSGPLNFIPEGVETTEVGGCYAEYLWCHDTTRVPLYVYLFCFIVFFGLAFPFVETPAAALFSEVLGPRKQGTMQGFFSLGGSIAPVIGSITSTALFKYTGYRYIIILQSVILVIGGALILIFYKRLVPLKLIKKTESEKVTN